MVFRIPQCSVELEEKWDEGGVALTPRKKCETIGINQGMSK